MIFGQALFGCPTFASITPGLQADQGWRDVCPADNEFAVCAVDEAVLQRACGEADENCMLIGGE